MIVGIYPLKELKLNLKFVIGIIGGGHNNRNDWFNAPMKSANAVLINNIIHSVIISEF